MKGRERNQPCLCRSGKKYKKCCGQSAPTTAQSAPTTACHKLAGEAKRLMTQGRNHEALEKALTIFNGNHLCIHWERCGHMVVEIYLGWQMAAMAQKAAQRLVAAHPECPEGLYQLGRSMLLQGDSGGALAYLNAASAASDKMEGVQKIHQGHMHLFKAAADEQRQDIIDSHLAQWSNVEALDPQSRYFLALCLYHAKKFDRAFTILTELKKTSSIPHAAIAHELGMCAQAQGDYSSARQNYLDSIELDPLESHYSYSALSILDNHLGNGAAAVEWARRAYNKAPKQNAYRVNLAAALAGAGLYSDSAREYLEVAQVIQDPGLRYSGAIALLKADDYEGCLRELRHLEMDGWELSVIHINIGVALAHRRAPGDLEQALSLHKKALTEFNEGIRHAILTLNTIGILASLKNLREASALAAHEPPSSWPEFAKEELLELRSRLEREFKAQFQSDAIRLFGWDPFQMSSQAHVFIHLSHGGIAHVELGDKLSAKQAEAGGSNLTRKTALQQSATIGIITALPEEYAAVESMLDNPAHYSAKGAGAGRRYLIGEIPALGDGTHVVALGLLADTGNNNASARATQLINHFPEVQHIIMCGIAGGIPHPDKLEDDVRLGDVVISDRMGVVEYDFIKQDPNGKIEYRNPPRPPSAEMIEAVKLLSAGEFAGRRPWEVLLSRGDQIVAAKRPSDSVDAKGDVIVYPLDSKRRPNQPRIHVAPIASANRVLKDAAYRNVIRDKFKVRAVEMEGSGIADSSWLNGRVGYLVVRGICDYCDDKKGDVWHAYAALIAGAYVRSLLQFTPVFDVTH